MWIDDANLFESTYSSLSGKHEFLDPFGKENQAG
jgi:hypothetical protein